MNRTKRAKRVASVIALWLSACVAPPGSQAPTQQATPPAQVATGPVLAVPSATPEDAGAVPDPAVVAPATSQALPIDADDAVLGSPVAPVTIVEFQDLQCPFCARVQPTLGELLARYGEAQVRLVLKHNPLPFHEQALPAARFVQAVTDLGGSRLAFAFAQKLFASQNSLGDEHFRTVARALGLDAEAVAARAGSAEVQAAVERDMALADALGANGTPAFFINGELLSGAQPKEKFAQLIDAELHEARALLAAGVPSDALYRSRVAANLQPPDAAASPKPKKPPAPPKPDDTTIWKIPIAGAPSDGAKDALVTLVEFTDHQCPFCKKVQPTLDELRRQYGSDLRLVVHLNPLPFHPRAMPAAELALEARAERGDAAFFDATRLLFASQPKLEDADLMTIAARLGLDAARVQAAIAKEKHKKAIDTAMSVADDYDARGTPHFFANGYRIVGAQPVAKFVAVIDARLAEARALVARGIPRAKVYAEIMKGAKEPPPPEQKTVAAPTAANPSRGPTRAAVVVHVFADFECPFCKRVEPTLSELEKKYKGKLRLVWHNLPLPFHTHAMLAANAAMEAFAQGGNGAFWKMHDLLFEAQGRDDAWELATLSGYAKQLGLNVARFEQALNAELHQPAIAAEAAAADAAGIKGTPGFVINGYYVSGSQPLRAFTRVVDYALKHPRKK